MGTHQNRSKQTLNPHNNKIRVRTHKIEISLFGLWQWKEFAVQLLFVCEPFPVFIIEMYLWASKIRVQHKKNLILIFFLILPTIWSIWTHSLQWRTQLIQLKGEKMLRKQKRQCNNTGRSSASFRNGPIDAVVHASEGIPCCARKSGILALCQNSELRMDSFNHCLIWTRSVHS